MKAVLAGGDRRMELTRELLIGRGHTVHWLRNDWDHQWQMLLPQASTLLLPYPYALKEGVVPGLENGGEGCVETLMEKLRPGTLIMSGAGLGERIAALANARGLRLQRYDDDPVFLQRNAEISAEAAINVLMTKTDRVLDEQRILLMGYGVFGRAIALRLKALGARVWVAARRKAQQHTAICDGMRAIGLEQIPDIAPGMDAVLNTIPAVVLGTEQLKCFSETTLFLELASPPYGIDLPSAASMALTVELLPGLPSKYAPLSAARALCETILKRFEEGWV